MIQNNRKKCFKYIVTQKGKGSIMISTFYKCKNVYYDVFV